MGCTTSAVVIDGLRTVLERNCSGYICKGAAEPVGPSQAERALSRRESRALPTPRLLKVCVCVSVCLSAGESLKYREITKTASMFYLMKREAFYCSLSPGLGSSRFF